MIKKVVHLADIHIRKSTARHQEYRNVFANLIKQLKQDKPDRIVVVGDLFHDYIKLEGELVVLASEFLNALANVAPVIITRGNHDVARTAPNRTDAIEALVTAMANTNITYFNKTGLYDDLNVVWAVWKHGEKRNNPWNKNFVKDPAKTYIDLFHDPVNGSSNADGYEFKSRTYRATKEFMGDISMFGDIHMLQYLDPTKTKAYSSSLIEQNFSEGNGQFHGYLLWDLATKTAQEVAIANDYAHLTVDVNRFTDFDKLQLEVNSPATYKRIRVKWKTLPNVKNIENMRKVDTLLTNKYAPLSIKHVNDFIEEKKIKIEERSDIENIGKREVIHRILSEYLKKMGTEDDIIQNVLDLDTEIENRLVTEEMTNIQWSIVSLKGKNFRSYDTLDINWENKDGLYQIVGENGVGKSTINQLITYILFGKSLETDFRKKFGDARFINNKLPVGHCEGSIVLEANGEYYGIKRITIVKKNKEGELTAASTTTSYYKLNGSTDELEDQFNIEKLNENDRFKTQERINEIIGTYENFIRVTLTTSDTLNNVLSSDKAPFIDSLLFDSGLDVFDVRLKEYKKYKDELIIDRSLASVSVVNEENSIAALNSNIKLKREMIASTKDKIVDQKKALDLLNQSKEVLQESMHQIDAELSATNENQINATIASLNVNLKSLEQEETRLQATVAAMKSTFDSNRLSELMLKKDNHKQQEFEKRSAINKKKMDIVNLNYAITKINGDIDQLMREGSGYKKQIKELEESKTCHACGQTLGAEHEQHIRNSIKEHESVMFQVAADIKKKQAEKPTIQASIVSVETEIKSIEDQIKNDDLGIQNVLEEIGKLNNDKAEVEKRDRLNIELSTYPTKKENFQMKITGQQDMMKRFVDQKNKIEENRKLKEQIVALNNKIMVANGEIEYFNKSIVEMEGTIVQNENTIKQRVQLIKDYLDYEKKEQVRKLYEEIIHRDGLPTQILTDTLLPNINNVLAKLLETADFDVYLDKDDLRLKFFYNDHPNAIIDCISASGMERTFAVYALKIALNQINSKSKSTLLTVDEVMGKLKGEYVEKFVDLLHLSKKFYKKVLIIEPTHEVNPDYILHIEKDENHISKLIVN